MLTALRTSDNEKVLARSSAKPDAPFMCPACRREVVLHKGLIRIPHFATRPVSHAGSVQAKPKTIC